MKKNLRIGTAIICLSVAAWSGIASAHSGGVSGKCEGGIPVLRVNLTSYNGNNGLWLEIDGVLGTTSFGASYVHSYSLVPTVEHVVYYTVLAHDDPNNTHGWSPSGSFTIPVCQVPPTAVPTTTTTVVIPTTQPPATTPPIVVEPPTVVAPPVVIEPPAIVAVDVPPVVLPETPSEPVSLPATGLDVSTGGFGGFLIVVGLFLICVTKVTKK